MLPFDLTKCTYFILHICMIYVLCVKPGPCTGLSLKVEVCNPVVPNSDLRDPRLTCFSVFTIFVLNQVFESGRKTAQLADPSINSTKKCHYK